ncbi:MAG TPA: aldo/keto reductase [Streptosporangiaceae bacterium]|nr:aldo/keto reductase [Streptosporangiaceae bacterium]
MSREDTLPWVSVGSGGVRVTELVLGTAPLGGLFAPVSGDDAASTLSAAWDAGVRAFDTAPHYGVGLAEQRLLTGILPMPGRRLTPLGTGCRSGLWRCRLYGLRDPELQHGP